MIFSLFPFLSFTTTGIPLLIVFSFNFSSAPRVLDNINDLPCSLLEELLLDWLLSQLCSSCQLPWQFQLYIFTSLVFVVIFLVIFSSIPVGLSIPQRLLVVVMLVDWQSWSRPPLHSSRTSFFHLELWVRSWILQWYFAGWSVWSSQALQLEPLLASNWSGTQVLLIGHHASGNSIATKGATVTV